MLESFDPCPAGRDPAELGRSRLAGRLLDARPCSARSGLLPRRRDRLRALERPGRTIGWSRTRPTPMRCIRERGSAPTQCDRARSRRSSCRVRR